MNGAAQHVVSVRDFVGKTVLVTGGAQGIGRGIAGAFAARGASVAIVDLRVDAASEAARLLAQQGGTARAYAADMAEYAQIEHLVAR